MRKDNVLLIKLHIKHYSLKIIGLMIGLVLVLVPEMGYAFFSPYLANQTTQIRSNIQSARQTNGVGSFTNALDRLREENARVREGNDPNAELKNTGDFELFVRSIKNIINVSLITSFADDASLLFSPTITQCRRSDIYELKALREQVTNELFKAAILNDHRHSELLWSDYQDLNRYLDIVNSDQKVLGSQDTTLLFGSNTQNYYADCPYSPFSQAFVQLKNSFENLKNVGNRVDFSASAIVSAAEKRAKKRAEQWIKANRVELRLSGQTGPKGRSLIQGPGSEQLIGELRTSLELAKTEVDSIVGTFDGSYTRFSNLADEYEKVEAARDVLTQQIEAGITMNLDLNNVGEQDLYTIDDAMVKINSAINRALTPSGTVNQTLMTFCKKIASIPQNQCTNKQSLSISCKD